MVLSLNTMRAKQDGIIIQETNMKRDLYRYAKERRDFRNKIRITLDNNNIKFKYEYNKIYF